MSTLLVSPYAPARDGIAAYAVQLAKQMRESGERVTVLSPSPSAAQLHLAYAGPRGSAALGRRMRAYDHVVVQYHPMFHYDSASFPRRTATDLVLGEALRLAGKTTAYVHEVEYEEFTQSASRRRAGEFFWSGFDDLIFHSEHELQSFRDIFPKAAAHGRVNDHGESFYRRTQLDRDAARRSLGIDDGSFMFLSIGFIQRHKGFDRAVRAFASLDMSGARLDIVGSTRTEEPEFMQYLAELRFLSEHTAGVELHEGYTSDEKFDRWISACDVVVLPYRQIWSSGVLERAKLFDKPVIAIRVGGLADQADPQRTTLVASDSELRRAMAAAAGLATEAALVPSWDIEAEASWVDIQRELEQRALAVSGPSVGRSQPSFGATPGRASLSAPLRNIPGYVKPAATSIRPGVSTVKRAIDRAVSWRVDPLARQVETMRLAMTTALDSIERRLPPPSVDVDTPEPYGRSGARRTD